MSSTINKQPIKVGILEISSQNRAILEFFFSGAGKSYFNEVDLDKASAYIIDYDSLGAKESWESTFNETKKPGIIISIKEVNLPSTIWLQKPLTVKALTEAGESIRKMMLDNVSPEPVTKKSEKKKVTASEADIVIIEDSAEDILDGEKPLEALDTSPQIQAKDINTKPETLSINDIIDLPSKPIDLILQENKISEDSNDNVDIFVELQKANKSEVKIEPQEEALDFEADLITLIDETAESPKEELLVVEETAETQASANSVEPLITTKEKPKLSDTGTKESTSSSNFASSENFIDVDLSLEDPDIKNDKTESEQKSSTTPVDGYEATNSNEDDDIDSLLESLISGETNEKPVTEPHDKVSNIVTTSNDELTTLETVEVEVKTITPDNLADIPEITNINSKDFAQTNTKASKVLPKEEDHAKTAEEELQSLLEEIRQEAEGSPVNSTSTSSHEKSEVMQKYAPTNAEERWKALCGESNTTDLQKIIYFNPSNHLITPLIQNIKRSKESGNVLRMKFNGFIIVIDPELDRIYCDRDISSDFYANICYELIPLEKIKVHQLDKSEIRLYRKKMKEDAVHTHYIEAFIWTSSLLTSRGRLPKNTNMKNKIGLTSWPNLTRVEAIPHMMQIAALFHKNTWSLFELINKSDIQKNYVIAFYNAALALDVIQIDGETTNSTPLDLKTNNKKHRSFLSRFLKKLTA